MNKMNVFVAHELLHQTLFNILQDCRKGQINGDRVDEASRVLIQTAEVENPEAKKVPMLLKGQI